MPHKTEVIETVNNGNGTFSLNIGCCDKKHSGWTAVAASVAADAQQLKAHIENHHKVIAAAHEEIEKGDKNLAEYLGNTMEHQ